MGNNYLPGFFINDPSLVTYKKKMSLKLQLLCKRLSISKVGLIRFPITFEVCLLIGRTHLHQWQVHFYIVCVLKTEAKSKKLREAGRSINQSLFSSHLSESKLSLGALQNPMTWPPTSTSGMEKLPGTTGRPPRRDQALIGGPSCWWTAEQRGRRRGGQVEKRKRDDEVLAYTPDPFESFQFRSIGLLSQAAGSLSNLSSVSSTWTQIMRT